MNRPRITQKTGTKTGATAPEGRQAATPYINNVEPSTHSTELADALLHCYEFQIHIAELLIPDRTVMTQRTKRQGSAKNSKPSSEEHQLFGSVSRNMERFCLPRSIRYLQGHDPDRIEIEKELGRLVLREAEDRTLYGRKRLRVEKWESKVIENIRTIRRVAKRHMIRNNLPRDEHVYSFDEGQDAAKFELNRRVFQFNINPSGASKIDEVEDEVGAMLQELRQAIHGNIEAVLSDRDFMSAANKKVEIARRITGGVLHGWNTERGDFFRDNMENQEEARLFKEMIQQAVRCLGYDDLDVEILTPDSAKDFKVVGFYAPKDSEKPATIYIPLVRYDYATHDNYSNGNDLDETWYTVAHEIAHHDMEKMGFDTAGETAHAFLHAHLTRLRKLELELLKFRFYRDDSGKVQVEISSNAPNYYLEMDTSQKDDGNTVAVASDELIPAQNTEGVIIAGRKFLAAGKELILAFGRVVGKLWKDWNKQQAE